MIAKKLLNAHELNDLHEALYYMKINELKGLCATYSLPIKGNKVALINRITVFIETGKVVHLQEIPSISKANKNRIDYSLELDALMLYGAYKNDAKTRSFFKTVFGNHFHFTAFGIDWLNERWISGNPPTYREFALFWQQEYLNRKQTKVVPKKEWAYINFTQQFLIHNPAASKKEIITAWEKERMQYVYKIKNLLDLT